MKTYLPKHAGKCAKVHVVAKMVAKNGEEFESSNFCLTPQTSCPRDEQGYKSGEGYHLCKTICNQVGHAEENVIYFAKKEGTDVRDSTIYVDYTWICDNCKSVCASEGIHVTIEEKKDAIV